MIPFRGRKHMEIIINDMQQFMSNVKLNNPFTGPVLMSKTHIGTKI